MPKKYRHDGIKFAIGFGPNNEVSQRIICISYKNTFVNNKEENKLKKMAILLPLNQSTKKLNEISSRVGNTEFAVITGQVFQTGCW